MKVTENDQGKRFYIISNDDGKFIIKIGTLSSIISKQVATDDFLDISKVNCLYIFDCPISYKSFYTCAIEDKNLIFPTLEKAEQYLSECDLPLLYGYGIL